MLSVIRNRLLADADLATVPIKFYHYPEAGDKQAFIVIKPLGPPISAYGGSDVELSQQLTYQIDVQAVKRLQCKQLQQKIKTQMYSLGFCQLPEGLDEYFFATKRFVDVRRYRVNTPMYHTDY